MNIFNACPGQFWPGYFLCATAGLHRPAPPEEFPLIVGPEVAARLKVISHDAFASGILQQVGVSSRGTPIWLHRHYLEAGVEVIILMEGG
ncbi:lactate racemase domain-containing protein [Neomoorella carbonis]|uniref:lactate racemase domain-containing protein n=1 Tax=Neomoorella carbonis TaxID=3062783 RepID=UPI0032483685